MPTCRALAANGIMLHAGWAGEAMHAVSGRGTANTTSERA